MDSPFRDEWLDTALFYLVTVGGFVGLAAVIIFLGPLFFLLTQRLIELSERFWGSIL